MKKTHKKVEKPKPQTNMNTVTKNYSREVGSILDSTKRDLLIASQLPLAMDGLSCFLQRYDSIKSSDKEGEYFTMTKSELHQDLHNLLKLEADYHITDTKRSKKFHVNDKSDDDWKSKEQLQDLIRNLATAVSKTYENDKYDVLKVVEKQNNSCLVGKILKQVDDMKQVYCDRISITDEEEKTLNRQLRNLRQRCDTHTTEIDKLTRTQELTEKRQKEEETSKRTELIKLQETYKILHEQQKVERVNFQTREHKMIQQAQEEHSKNQKYMEKELRELEVKLEEVKQTRQKEVTELQTRLENLQDEMEQQNKEFIHRKEEIDESILHLTDKYQTEQRERERLETYFDKIDTNAEICKNEEKIIQRVYDLEIQAESILNHGALQLQKIFRGCRDRAIVAKLKQKKKKKSKKKGATKKK